MLTSTLQTGIPDPPMGQGEVAIAESSLHPWTPKSGHRRPVKTGVEVWVMKTSPRGGGSHTEEVWSSGSGYIYISGNDTLSAVVLFNASNSSGVGCHGADVASPGGWPSVVSGSSLANSSLVLELHQTRVWFSDPISLLNDSPWEITIRKDLLSQAGGSILRLLKPFFTPCGNLMLLNGDCSLHGARFVI